MVGSVEYMQTDNYKNKNAPKLPYAHFCMVAISMLYIVLCTEPLKLHQSAYSLVDKNI